MIRNAIKIVFLGLGLLLFACHPNPANMRQAGRDALENGRIQLDSGNKAEAMRFSRKRNTMVCWLMIP